MQERIDEFKQIGAEVVTISFVEPSRLKQYLADRPWSFRVLADPARAAYQAFGLERASWWQMLQPGVIATYIGLMMRGRMPKAAKEDVHQLGGDLILDATGRLIYEHRSSNPADRPTVSELLDVLTVHGLT